MATKIARCSRCAGVTNLVSFRAQGADESKAFFGAPAPTVLITVWLCDLCLRRMLEGIEANVSAR